MRVFDNLEPKSVFHYFEDICLIPHGSGNLQQISDYLVEFAKTHNLRYRQDEALNVIIWKDATPGYENGETVILQGHMDMVAVKDADCDLNMETEGLRPAITEDGEWVYAKQTSLGGDDGIAVAYALAILASDDIPHPALEVVLTVDEEIGLLGAAALDASDLKGTILMNMDSEDDGIFLISCAGGATVDCRVPIETTECSGVVYHWRMDGLQGGHSGAEIHKGMANANCLLGRYLTEVGDKVSFQLADICGGEKDNAIPVFSQATLLVASDKAAMLEEETAIWAATVKSEFASVDGGMSVHLVRQDGGKANVLTDNTLAKVKQALVHLPFGIQRMMPDIPNMVQTSLNMGVITRTENHVSMTFSVRSSVKSEINWLIRRMQDLMDLLGGTCDVAGMYPAWEYKADSKIRGLMADTYEEMFGEKPVLEAIHAGVECGLLSEKIPGLDCISYGPQMRAIHTPRERLNIKSVERNYLLTLKVLEKLK